MRTVNMILEQIQDEIKANALLEARKSLQHHLRWASAHSKLFAQNNDPLEAHSLRNHNESAEHFRRLIRELGG